mmetsp:Transcript_31983/g.60220  ORF Transcript_31983/g.60220 Transcript_31983/m.60220 type:complete len:84 (-) Transcript_31983:131-382(-)
MVQADKVNMTKVCTEMDISFVLSKRMMNENSSHQRGWKSEGDPISASTKAPIAATMSAIIRTHFQHSMKPAKKDVLGPMQAAI